MDAAAESGWAIIPATQFVDMSRNIEREFSLHNAHEPDNLSRKEGVVRALNELLMDKLGVGLVIARQFARLRTYIRMKAITPRASWRLWRNEPATGENTTPSEVPFRVQGALVLRTRTPDLCSG